jgi:hypothetical protein
MPLPGEWGPARVDEVHLTTGRRWDTIPPC